jgi:nucleotide-binding universal stress UspA family protein
VVRTELVEGSAYDVLPERARDGQLLVVGRWGHSAVARPMLGSAALHAVVRARCPVMVIHPAAVPPPAPHAPVAG